MFTDQTLPSSDSTHSTEDEEEEERDITEQKRVDFIRLLPPEVVLLILSNLSTNELFGCLDVSLGWKDRIENYPSLWRQVTIGDEDYELIDKLEWIGRHVRSYTIYQACQEILDGSASILVSGCMDNLTSLEKLNISLPTSEISHLEYTLTTTHHLTHLNWSSGSTVPVEQVYEIFDACPNLIFFKVSYCDFSDLSAIRSKCPKHLRVLGLNDEKITVGIDWDVSADGAEPGLYDLTTTCHDNTSWETFQQVLVKDENTLRNLSLFCSPSRDPTLLFSTFQGRHMRLSEGHVGWRYYSTIQIDAVVMNHPLSIFYEFSRNYVDQSFPWLIDGIKMDRIQTKKIKINRCGNIGPHLFSLLDFHRLQELCIDGCQVDTLDEFIPRLGSSISSIAFRNIVRLKDSTVALLATVPNLKRVELFSCEFLSDQGLRMLLDGCPRLKELDVRHCKSVTQAALDSIKETLDQRNRTE
ncbi:hypothetical protein BJV82DRAFT_661199 [Fennellomyces sp. T-0311]|nr:hypothetical protein BJV82DRAFT_661199 [Fennellomyces sp. T-0311]